jgi:hypothetical protein
MGLGAVHTISVTEAREAALKCRKQLHEAIDPIEARDRERASKRLQDDSSKLLTAITLKLGDEEWLAMTMSALDDG